MFAFAVILTALCCLAGAPLVANAATMHRNDPAGRGLASAFGAINATVFAIVLAGLSVGCWGYGRAPLGFLAVALPVVVAVGGGWLAVFTIPARSTIVRRAFVGPAVATALAICLPQWRFYHLVGGELLLTEIAAACLIVGLSLLPWGIQKLQAIADRRHPVVPPDVEGEQ